MNQMELKPKCFILASPYDKMNCIWVSISTGSHNLGRIFRRFARILFITHMRFPIQAILPPQAYSPCTSITQPSSPDGLQRDKNSVLCMFLPSGRTASFHAYFTTAGYVLCQYSWTTEPRNTYTGATDVAGPGSAVSDGNGVVAH